MTRLIALPVSVCRKWNALKRYTVKWREYVYRKVGVFKKIIKQPLI